jgi:hypothetical protein
MHVNFRSGSSSDMPLAGDAQAGWPQVPMGHTAASEMYAAMHASPRTGDGQVCTAIALRSSPKLASGVVAAHVPAPDAQKELGRMLSEYRIVG